MENAKRLFIGITKTALKSVTVDYNEDGTCDFVSTIALLTESGKEIATKSYGTKSWYMDKVELGQPVMAEQAAKILGVLMHEAAEKNIQGFDGLIEEKKTESESASPF